MGRGGSHGGRAYTDRFTSGFSSKDRSAFHKLERVRNNTSLSFKTRVNARLRQIGIQSRYATGTRLQELRQQSASLRGKES